MTKWVQQKDVGGCGAAVIAMILGWSYDKAKAEIDASPVHRLPIDWTTGITETALDCVLGDNGYYIRRVYVSWERTWHVPDDGPAHWEFKSADSWPPKPFAPIHYAQVKQPSNHYHFVVVLEDGSVLDPFHQGDFLLTDWPEVISVTGLVRA